MSFASAPVAVRPLSHHGAEWGTIEHTTVEHAAVFEGEMKALSISGGRFFREPNDMRLPARAADLYFVGNFP
jgi:hypothetical protein